MQSVCSFCGASFEGDGNLCDDCDSLSCCDDCGARVANLTDANGSDVCDTCLAENYTQCDDCRTYIHKDDAIESPGGGNLCRECFDNSCTHCVRCGNAVNNDDTHSSPDDGSYCEMCFDNHCFNCSSCNETHWLADSREAPNGDSYCEDCYSDSCTYCEDCGETLWSDDAQYVRNTCYCSRCAPCESNQGEFSPVPFNSSGEHGCTGSNRRYGVEIETNICSDYEDLEGKIPFEAKEDGSIRGMEFASTILHGDDGLMAIENLCDFAKKHNWNVDSRCGLHIHLDASKEKTESLKAAALAYNLTFEVWLALVNPGRGSSCFCERSRSTLTELRDITKFSVFANRSHRYEWINFSAYAKYKTFEVRLHQGSIDAREICNWIRIHTIFMDWATSKTFDEVKQALFCKNNAEKFDFILRLCQEVNCSDLAAYYVKKAARNSQCNWAAESAFALCPA